MLPEQRRGRLGRRRMHCWAAEWAWYAHLLDLGYIVRPERVASAVKSIMEMNGTASPYGVVNTVLPDGSIDVRNQHSPNIWPGDGRIILKQYVSLSCSLPKTAHEDSPMQMLVLKTLLSWIWRAKVGLDSTGKAFGARIGMKHATESYERRAPSTGFCTPGFRRRELRAARLISRANASTKNLHSSRLG